MVSKSQKVSLGDRVVDKQRFGGPQGVVVSRDFLCAWPLPPASGLLLPHWSNWRKQVEAAVADIVVKRREIQFTAGAAWPHTNPANAGFRMEFQLPADRVMK